jgi:hypothetical protein
MSGAVRKRTPAPRRTRRAFAHVCPNCGEEIHTHIVGAHCENGTMENELEKVREARALLGAIARFLPHLVIQRSR